MVSVLVAIVAAYTALDLVGRIISARGRAVYVWIAGGAFAMGVGSWSTHFIGMLAFVLPIDVGYDVPLALLSLLIAILSSGFALWLAARPLLSAAQIGLGGLLLGLGISAMHYTGMAAATFADGSFCGALPDGLSSNGLDRIVLVASLSILGIALFSCILDSHLETRTAVPANSLTEANQELTHLALHDNLTGLPNRVLLTDRIEQAMKKVSESGGCFALMFMDLDGFKPVNDAFGHHTGDLLLRQVALRLRNNLHRHDTLARIGGDEFVLLVELHDPQDALAVATRQVNEIGNPFTIGEHQLQISLSIGICMYPGNGNTQHELLINADAAMYHTKAAGKNGYSFFDASMNSNARNQLQMSQDLRKAIKHRQFCIYYQPKFDALTGLPLGAEALLRWNHPEQGVMGPDQFIAMAEKTGLIIQIGEWVLDEACRQMREWYTQGYAHWRIAVNLSALQFCHAGLVTAVADTLARHQLPANCLTLEITETTAMHDADASLAVLQRLSEMGVDLSIDDFGTGYSSLSQLHALALTKLK
ncbi:putative bifunctional diguanylate cyclase/phosphodiesterase, partial [Pseudomonas savastanoi]|uniref:putative bifunctional diguanylate cyclase/phosphodiesterase n=1 Tax=Pseudomonas savastanoi TaxID=29438 RepID=UPI001F21115E